MGYRSNIIIGLHKNIMARNLVTNELPSFFKYETPEQFEDSFYWKFEGFKWYSSYPEIVEMEAYFAKLTSEAKHTKKCDDDCDNRAHSLFGVIRLAEDDADDTTEWGDPLAFGLELSSSIDSPVGSLY
jgi:hypothetical protein